MKGFRSGSLGSIEFWGINTLPHRLFHKYVQFPIFKDLLRKQDIDLTGASILDAGCGSGYEAELVLCEFAYTIPPWLESGQIDRCRDHA